MRFTAQPDLLFQRNGHNGDDYFDYFSLKPEDVVSGEYEPQHIPAATKRDLENHETQLTRRAVRRSNRS